MCVPRPRNSTVCESCCLGPDRLRLRLRGSSSSSSEKEEGRKTEGKETKEKSVISLQALSELRQAYRRMHTSIHPSTSSDCWGVTHWALSYLVQSTEWIYAGLFEQKQKEAKNHLLMRFLEVFRKLKRIGIRRGLQSSTTLNCPVTMNAAANGLLTY